MPDILADLQGVTKLNGDTYSSAEVLGMVVRASIEIERLRADLAHALEALRRVRDFPYVGVKASHAIVCIARDGLREYEQNVEGAKP